MAQTVREIVPATETLEKELSLFLEEEKTLKDRMVKRREKINNLNEEQSSDATALRDCTYKVNSLRNRLFARTSLSPEFVTVRSALVLKVRRSRSENITIARQKALKEEIAREQSQLQLLCQHRFVFSYDGYRGSASDDWDDKRSGRRICAHCNFGEASKGTAEDIYNALLENGMRLIRRDLRSKKERPQMYGQQEWFSLEFLAQLFEDSAYGINIEWPKTIDKKALLIM